MKRDLAVKTKSPAKTIGLFLARSGELTRKLAMLGSLAALAAGCSSASPGLDVHLALGSHAASSGAVGSVVINVANETGTFAAAADSAVTGGFILKTDGSSRLQLVSSPSYQPRAAQDVLLQLSNKTAINVALSATAYDKSGAFLGRVDGLTGRITPTDRTRVNVTIECLSATCTTVGDPTQFDLGHPPSTPRLQTIVGSAASQLLTPVGFIHLGATLALVATQQATGQLLFFPTVNSTTTAPIAQLTISDAMLVVQGIGDHLGEAVAIGDIDGNGSEDLVATASNASYAAPSMARATSAGAAYIFKNEFLQNSANRTIGTNLIDLTAHPAPRILSTTSMELLGASITLAHLSSTVLDDIILGAPGPFAAGPPNVDRRAGRVYIVTPQNTNWDSDVILQPGATAISAIIYGAVDQVPIGRTILSGLIDDDTVPDLAIGSSAELSNRGVVYVLSGKTLQAATTSTTANIDLSTSFDGKLLGAVTLNSAAVAAEFGAALAIADVDGDSKNELLVGAPGESAAYGFEGANALVEQSSTEPAPNYDLLIRGPGASRFGTAIAQGQIDSTLGSDLVIGASSYNALGTRTGAGGAFVVLSSLVGAIGTTARKIDLNVTTPSFTIDGTAQPAGMLPGLGDHVLVGNYDQADATDEIIIGEQNGGDALQGEIYVLFDLP